MAARTWNETMSYERDARVAAMLGHSITFEHLDAGTADARTQIEHRDANGERFVVTIWDCGITEAAGRGKPWPAYTSDLAADYDVLRHVRETWDEEARTRFAQELLLIYGERWRAMLKRRETLPFVPHELMYHLLCYQVGDYSRAALAVWESERKD